MLVWLLVAALTFGVAMLLAAADGALLASAHEAPRERTSDPERAHRALALGRVLAHLVTGMAVALAMSQAFIMPVALVVGLILLVANVALVEGTARDAGCARLSREPHPPSKLRLDVGVSTCRSRQP